MTGPYFYYYLGEPVPLGVTPDVVAVYDRAQGSMDPLERLVAEAGVPEPFVEPHPVRGWYTVRFDAASAEAPPGLPSLIERLAEHDAEGRFFFSPVFVGPNDGTTIVPAEILLQFEPTVGPGDVERLLRAGGVRGGTRQPFTRILENAFKIRTNERSGIEVLAISNRLSEMAEVVFAEPNMIVSGRSAKLLLQHQVGRFSRPTCKGRLDCLFRNVLCGTDGGRCRCAHVYRGSWHEPFDGS